MDLQRIVNEEKKKQLEIIADMTRQYKAVEEEKNNQINKLDNQKMENSDEIK